MSDPSWRVLVNTTASGLGILSPLASGFSLTLAPGEVVGVGTGSGGTYNVYLLKPSGPWLR